MGFKAIAWQASPGGDGMVEIAASILVVLAVIGVLLTFVLSRR